MDNEYKTDEYFLYDSYQNDKNNFNQLIGRFFRAQYSEVLNEIKLANKKLTNEEFYNIYSKYVKPYTVEYKQKKSDELMNSFGVRQDKFINNIEQLFKLSNTRPAENLVYLDYGCNDGAFALAIQKHFKIEPKNVYCVDLIDKPYIVEKMGYNYIKLDLERIEESLSVIPEVNLVSIINVIHHIPPMGRDELFKIINKHIKPKSHILVKEHNCGPEQERKYHMYISEWHKMYKVLYGEKDTMGELYLMNVGQISAYMHLLDSFLKKIIHEKDDILKAYYALFIKK